MKEDGATDRRSEDAAAFAGGVQRDPVTVVRRYASSNDSRIRINAVRALSTIADDYPAAIDVLLRTLFSENQPEVRDVILDELAQGAAADELRKQIADLERSDDPSLRRRGQVLRTDLWLRGFGRDEQESIGAVINVVIGRAQKSTDAHLEDRLSRVTGREREWAASHLRELLDHPSESVRQHAYLLIGRLRLRGSPLGRPDVIQEGASTWQTWRRRLAAAWSSESPEATLANRLRLSLLWPVIRWALAATIVLSLYLWATSALEPPAGFYPTLMVLVVALVSVLTLPAVRAVTPIHLYYDRIAAAAVQLVLVTVWTIGVAAIGTMALLLTTSFREGILEWAFAVGAGCLWLCGTVAAVRVGTIAALAISSGSPATESSVPGNESSAARGSFVTESSEPGNESSGGRRSFAELLRRPPVVFFCQVLGGASLGLAVTTILLVLSREAAIYQRVEYLARLVEGFWLLLVPISAGLAAAFAGVDRILYTPAVKASNEQGRGKWLPSALAAGVLLAPLLVGLCAVTISIVQKASSRASDIAASGQRLPVRQWIASSPTRFDFRVAFPQRVLAEVPQQRDGYAGEPDFNIAIVEWTPSGRAADGSPECADRREPNQVASADDPPLTHSLLGWGCYSIAVDHGGEFEISGLDPFRLVLEERVHAVNPAVADRFTDRGGRAGYSLELALNADEAGDGLSTESIRPEFNGTVWPLASLPASQIVVVNEGDVAQLSVTPGIFRYQPPEPETESGADALAGKGGTTARPREEPVDVTFTIEVSKDGSPVVEEKSGQVDLLVPGSYSVRVAASDELPPGSSVALNLLTRRGLESSSAAVRPLPSPLILEKTPVTGTWPIPRSTQAVLEFEVRAAQVVRAKAPQVPVWQPFAFSSIPGDGTIQEAFQPPIERSFMFEVEALPGPAAEQPFPLTVFSFAANEWRLRPGRYRFVIRNSLSEDEIPLLEPVLELEFNPASAADLAALNNGS